MKPVVVFDWDGTLFDSAAYKRANFCKLFQDAFAVSREEAEAQHVRHTGLPRRDLFDLTSKTLRSRGLSEPEYAALSRRYTDMNIRCCRDAMPFPDAVDAVRQLRGMGVLLYVSSSSDPVELDAALEASGFAPDFQSAFGSESGFSKGAPHLLHIARLARCLPADMLFVGDDEYDVRLGETAGVESLRIVRASRGPEPGGRVVRSLVQLLDFAQRMGE